MQYIERDFSDCLEIELSNTGPGIDDKMRNEIFEPYFTTKKDRTVMPLPIARIIID